MRHSAARRLQRRNADDIGWKHERATRHAATKTTDSGKMTQHSFQNSQQAGRSGQLRRMLRAANSNIRTKVGLKSGPFDASALKENGADAKGTLITGLLVIYPLVASAGAVLAGLWFLGASGPV
jgi:hypothetical protein